MATTIDEIEVLIKANAASFEAELKAVKKELKQLEATSKASSKGVSTAMIAMGSVVANVVTGVVSKALSGLNNVLAESDQAYRDTSSSLTKLATVMRQRGATQAQFNEVVKLTEAEERLGVVSAAAQQNGLQELATYVGKAESLKQLTNVMNNLIVQQHGYNATADQALQTATMMGKVLQGQTGGMERIGYHLDEADVKLFNYGTEEERVALLTEIVNDNLGDMNRALGQTNVGKQVQLANTWGALKAQIGELATAVKNLLLPAFSFIANAVGRAIGYIKAFFKLFGVDTGNTVGNTADSMGSAAGAVGDYGDAADKAGKKVKKSLAAFDEMNVLTEQDSSSSSDSGGVDILGDLVPAVEAIDWGSLIPDIELPKWIKDLTKIFDGLDFKKITKSFKKLGQDIEKFLTPVKKILGDVWNTYLQPFVTWAGNDLLPAFMNALGGAIAVVGEVLGRVWESFLKPFIDFFLVPIAQFTGGIIVTVLNAIGDALHWISEQSVVLDFISDLAIAIGVAAAAFAAWNVIVGVVDFAMLALTGTVSGLPIALQGTSFAISTYTAGAGLATGATNLFSGAIGLVKGALEALSSTTAGVIVIIGAAVALFEAFKVACEMSEAAGRGFKTQQELIAEATNKAAWASERQKEALDAVKNAQLEASSAELQLLELTKTAKEKRELYNEMLNSGRYSQEDLTKAQLEAEIAEGRLDAGMKKLEETTQATIEAQDARHEAIMQEISATQEAEMRQMIIAGKYDEVRTALIELANEGKTFTLQSGEQYKLTADEAAALAANIHDALNKDAAGGYHKFIEETSKLAGDVTSWFHDIRNKAFENMSNMEPAGDNFANGVARGIIRNKWVVENAARELANAGNNAYKNALQIHSPSRVMMKSGSFFAEGVELGISEGISGVEKTATKMADIAIGAFDGIGSKIELPDVSKLAKSNLSEISSNVEFDVEKNEMIGIQVNLGEETLIDKIIDGINSSSYMRNRAVLNL